MLCISAKRVDQPNRLAHAQVGIHFDFFAAHFHIANGYREEELTPPRLLLQSFHRTGAQERQLELAHRPLHAQQQPIVWMARFIGPILIDDYCADQTAKLDQRVPVAPIARQTRRLDGEHGTDAAFTDRREQPLEAWTAQISSCYSDASSRD